MGERQMAAERRKSLTNAISITIGISGFAFGLWQLQLQREANDRAAGRIGAKLEIVRMEPRPDTFKHLFEKVHPEVDESVAHFKTVDDLLRLNPGVLVRNTGDEIIDGLRVETQERWVRDLDPGVPAGSVPGYKPLLEPSQREDYVLSEKLKPGDVAFIPVAKPLLKSVLQAQVPSKSDRKHHAFFEVRCYGRAAGAPTFERAQQDENIHLVFCWFPAEFSEEACKKYTEMTPTVRCGPRTSRSGCAEPHAIGRPQPARSIRAGEPRHPLPGTRVTPSRSPGRRSPDGHRSSR
jgi:hypothetical protein